MAYASQQGRAHTNPSAPAAKGVCQRCGSWVQRSSMLNQMEYRGAGLLPIGIWVCQRCYDRPNAQFMAIVLPADPVPVILPFPEPFQADETNYMALTTGSSIDPVSGLPVPSGVTMATTSGLAMTMMPYGRPVGLDQRAVMPLATVDGVVEHFGVPLSPLSIIGNGTPTVAVTFSVAHGLATDDQIAVEGLTSPLANGFFSVTVTGAMSLTYQTYSNIPSGSLLGARVLMITARVGLPLGYLVLQQVGP